MKLTKLFFSIASVCFSIAIMLFGVLAATQVTYTVTGRVSYEVADTFVLITTNKMHPAFDVHEDNLHIICQETLSLEDALIELNEKFGCEKITIQSGGTLN